jgi:dipeptidyl aminopeptidase/acylaminoacyl peptidase
MVPVGAPRAGISSALVIWRMTQHCKNLLWAWIVLSVAGCMKQAVQEATTPTGEFTRPVEITVQMAGTAVAGVAVKVIDEPEAARALVALASRVDLKDGIPESQSANYFESLEPVRGTEVFSTDAKGKVAIPGLRRPELIVAHRGGDLWLAPASETRDWKLFLGDDARGGEHALAALTVRPAVGDALAAAAKQALGKGRFDDARALARVARSSELAAEIEAGIVTALLAQAREAMQQNHYDAARQFATQAAELAPEQSEPKEVLRQILAEYGGELRVLTGHKGPVTSVAYSPDGKFILSGSDDATVKLWNVADDGEPRTFTGHRGAVTGVAFGPDGKLAVSGSVDGTLRLWDVATGGQIRATESLGWKVTAVAFRADGRFIASAADDNQVTLWTAPRMSRVRTFAGHGWRVTSVAFSAEGEYALSGSEDDSAKLWDVATGQEMRSLRNGLAAVTCVAFAPDGHSGLSGGKDKTVKLWNLATGRELREFNGHSDVVRAVAVTPDGRFAISASADGTVRLWDISTGTEARAFAGHVGAVTSVAVSPDGHHVVSGGADGTVRVWQLAEILWPASVMAEK